MWVRSDHGIRRALETPCNIVGGPEEANHLSSLRLTCEKIDNGVKFSHIDSWKNLGYSHRELKRPWNGISDFFDFGCTDVDGCIAKLCAIMNTSKTHHTHKVNFREDLNEIIAITPYTEMYHEHPHYILASNSGWKPLPSRADAFTGKSRLVMKERRNRHKKSRPRGFKRRRREIMELANLELSKSRNSVLADAPMLVDHNLLDVRNDLALHDYFSSFGGQRPHSSVGGQRPGSSLELDSSSPFGARKQGEPARRSHDKWVRKGAMEDDDNDDGVVPMDVDMVHPSGMSIPSFPINANQTKPLRKNKYQKRLGAKKAKRLEFEENADGALSPAEATMYSALSARCNYLAQDRPDISFSSKEVCREFSIPNANSYRKLKRLARYLCGLPRLVYMYRWQEGLTELMTLADADFAGRKETRRSTSGGVVMIGTCCIRHYAKTQTIISLSSGEAELHGIAQGAAQALGVQALLKDTGWNLSCHIHSDATAALGICRRKGLGKVCHLDCADIRVQEACRSKRRFLHKVDGKQNPADVLTKYVDRPTMQAALEKISMKQMSGRPECAPKAMGISTSQ